MCLAPERGAADRTESFVEIGDGFRRHAARTALRRAGHDVDLRRLHGLPLAGAQPVGAGIVGGRETQQDGRYARTHAMRMHDNHLTRLPPGAHL
jgi:hypothetical protein